MKKNMRKVLSVLLAAVCLISGGIYLGYLLDYRSGDDTYTEAEQIALQDVPPKDTENSEEPTADTRPAEPYWAPMDVEDDPNAEILAKKSLTALRQVNEDVVGWIWVPDTVIDYPIMHGEDNEFYLNHTWKKEKNAVGSIFLESLNEADMTGFNTILYGHNMKDGSMFTLLHDYQQKDFRDAHPYVYILTDAGVWRYEVYSAYEAKVTSDTYQVGMQWDKTKQEYIDRTLKKSVIKAGITPAITDRILTLSTCAGLGTEIRWVVHAYLPMELVS